MNITSGIDLLNKLPNIPTDMEILKLKKALLINSVGTQALLNVLCKKNIISETEINKERKILEQSTDYSKAMETIQNDIDTFTELLNEVNEDDGMNFVNALFPELFK